MKRIIASLMGLVFLLLVPFSYASAASAKFADPVVPKEKYPIFGPQGADNEDPHLWYGDKTYPRNKEQGITLEVDRSSVSFQSVIVNIRFDKTFIKERQVTGFYITANERIVDFFTPAWDESIKDWQRSYQGVRVALSDWNINSFVNLRVVAISHREPNEIDPNQSNRYVVGWSNKPPGFQLKPLPVIDRAAIDVLNAILAKLEQMKNQLSAKLDQVNNSVKKIYEVKPETQSKFNAALAGLQAKLPTQQLKEQAKHIQRKMDDAAKKINNSAHQIKFGEINWMNIYKTPALDFTDFKKEIEILRKILQISLWCEFFYFIILVLRPRLTV